MLKGAVMNQRILRQSIPSLILTGAALVPAGEAFAAAQAKTFKGPTDQSQYGPVQVSIVVKSKKITAVKVVNSPPDPRAVSIQGQAIPTLKRETLKAQSAKINTVSNATQTSEAYITSLKAAIKKAQKAKALK
jgi:uncharacterized protein with FMN-binding domain